MKKTLIIFCVFILAGCSKASEGTDDIVSGTYVLTDIDWRSNEVDLDGNGIFSGDVMEELIRIQGWYEPNNTASSNRSKPVGSSHAMTYFNMMLPYPVFVMTEDGYNVSNVGYALLTACISYSGSESTSDIAYQASGDIFLSNINKESYLEVTDDGFELHLKCKMFTTNVGEAKSYLVYTYKKI